MSNPLELFGKRMAQLMRNRGFESDQEFADKIKVSRPMVTNIKNGKGNPQYQTLLKIAVALNAPLADLFMEEREWKKKEAISFLEGISKEESQVKKR